MEISEIRNRNQQNFRPNQQNFRPNQQNFRPNRTPPPTRRNRYTNTVSGPSQLYYISGMFGPVQVPMLIDSRSAVTVIGEEV